MKQALVKYSGPVLLVLFFLSVVLTFFDVSIPTLVWWINLAAFLAAFGVYVVQQNLFAYVGKRIFESFLTLFIICSLTFLLLRVLPGGPFDQEKTLPPEIQANIEAKYNLNAPLIEQYKDYIIGLTQGNFGESYKYEGRSVSTIIKESLPASLQLGVYALILAFAIGIPLGLIAAANHNSAKDYISMLLAISGVSLPSFLVAPIMIILFSTMWGLLPSAMWNGPEYYILPVFVLGVRPAAYIARLTRGSVLEVISSDYIRTARSKGLSERTILYKHVLKNSLIPVLSYAGPLVAGILSGAFIIEEIFNVPGMAKHFVQSVTNRDYPLVLGVTVLFSAMLVISNLIVDLLYSYFDPRIKL